MIYNKPTNFMELLELQKVLDEKTSAARPSGFKPRQRTEFDLRMALDDEFNEFMKELPDELNFKTWKEKKHDPHKQLIEFTDCLFFLLGSLNDFKENWADYEIEDLILEFSTFEQWSDVNKMDIDVLDDFKRKIHESDLRVQYDLSFVFRDYFFIAFLLGYKRKDILNAYWEKWNINMGRDKKDWSL